MTLSEIVYLSLAPILGLARFFVSCLVIPRASTMIGSVSLYVDISIYA